MNVLKALATTQAAAAPSGISFSFRDSATSSGSANITIPASTQQGDLIILYDRVLNTAGTPATVVPSGFTVISNSALSTRRNIASYKIAASGDGGTTITGMTGTSSINKRMIVLNTNSTAPYVIVYSVTEESTDATPANQTVTASENSNPLVVLGFYGQGTTTTPAMTPTEDGSIGANVTIRYKIYNSSAADVTCSMGDGGAGNYLASCYIAGFTAAPSGSSLYSVISGLGLTTNLKLCLDAGDSSSYNPSVQTDKWLDVSGNGFDFFRGSGTGSDAADPTFNGSAGGLSAAEYWSFDGGDYFTYDTTNETWMQNLHKDNAVFSCFAVFDIPPSSVATAIAGTAGDLATNRIGFRYQRNAGQTMQYFVCTGSSQQNVVPGGGGVINSGLSAIGFTYNEATPASLLNDNGRQGTNSPTAITSPSASNATYTMQIAASGNAQRPFPDGSKLYCIAIWEGTALSATNLADIFSNIKGRFGF